MKLLVGLSVLLFSARTDAFDTILSVHGSGSTNVALCIGSILEELQARTKLPVRLSYRATGSSTSLVEFKNDFNTERPANDFGMGELTIAAEDWQAFQEKNITVMQLPTFFGAVNFFHSVPDMPNLNLTSCLLARIFMRDIQDWAHPDIREINPGLDKLFENEISESLGASLRIRVARRESGSGSTESITQYLNKACPRHFPAKMVGSLPDWPIDTIACRGNSGMTECIQSRAGTIGYLDAGFGVKAELQEVSLRNKYGRSLRTQDAIQNSGVGAKDIGILPNDPRDDFSSVSLLDQDGEWTWPITLLTYVYIRTDLSFLTDPNARSLLVAFVKTLYDPEYNTICNTKYGFTLPEGASLDLGKKGIELLEEDLGDEATPWIFEDKAQAIIGAGDYVISSIRSSYAAKERDSNFEQAAELRATVVALEERLANLTAMFEVMESRSSGDEVEFTESDETKILIGLILGAVSLGLVFCMGLFVVLGARSKAAGDAEEEPPKGRST